MTSDVTQVPRMRTTKSFYPKLLSNCMFIYFQCQSLFQDFSNIDVSAAPTADTLRPKIALSTCSAH